MRGVWDLDIESEKAIGVFTGKSVMEETLDKYKVEWKEWAKFIVSMGMPDPYMVGADRGQKVKLFMNFMRLRYEQGMRDRKATGGAGIKKILAMALLDTEWMDCVAIKIVRQSCKRNPTENREMVRSKVSRDKKPIWFELLDTVRRDMWIPGDWGYVYIDKKMISINIWFSFDLGLRGGESNQTGKTVKHTILNEDIIFWLYTPVVIDGSSLGAIRGGSEEMRRYVVGENVERIEVAAVTHKCGLVRAAKLIERRSDEEVTLMLDVVVWSIRSGTGPKDPLFSRRVFFPNRREATLKKCQASMISSVIKKYAELAGLDPAEFGTHSLRHGMVTQMHAFGVGLLETNARGNYARNSTLALTTYNGDDTGRGPLAAAASGVGRRVGVKDVKRQMQVPY